MGIWLEDKIKDAILAVRWKRDGEIPHPGYFVPTTPESFRLEASAASFLAHFIADHIITGQTEYQQESEKETLDKYSSEVLASYLEDQGYIVSSPD